MTKKLILWAAGAFFAATAGSQAQDLVLRESDWAVECGLSACSLTRSMVEETSGNRFASLAFAFLPQAADVQMAIFTPLGSAVQQPLTMKAGAVAREMRFTTCLAEGCLVLDRLQMDEVNGLTILPVVSLSFYAAEGDTPVTLDIPLSGLGEAIARAQESLGAQ